MQLRTGSREKENEPQVLQPCFGSVVNETLVTSPPFHVQPDLVILNSQLVAAIACPIHKLQARIFHGATVGDVRQLKRCDQIGHATSLFEVHLNVATARSLQEFEQLNLGNLPLPLLQKTPDVNGAEHDRFQLVQGTLNADPGCILPTINCRSCAARCHSEACQRARTSWFLGVSTVSLPTKRSVSSFTAGIYTGASNRQWIRCTHHRPSHC